MFNKAIWFAYKELQNSPELSYLCLYLAKLLRTISQQEISVYWAKNRNKTVLVTVKIGAVSSPPKKL